MSFSLISDREGNFLNFSSSVQSLIEVFVTLIAFNLGKSAPTSASSDRQHSGFSIMINISKFGNMLPSLQISPHWLMLLPLKSRWVTFGNIRSSHVATWSYLLRLRWSSWHLQVHKEQKHHKKISSLFRLGLFNFCENNFWMGAPWMLCGHHCVTRES